MSRYKLVVSDLDETLLGSDHLISKRNMEAIKEAQRQGVLFVPATGRNHISIQPMLEELDLKDRKDTYSICFNGAALVENEGNRILNLKSLPNDVARELYRRGLEYDACVQVYTLDAVYAYNFWQQEQRYMKSLMYIQEIYDRNLDFLEGQPILKVLYENEDLPYLHRIEAEMQDLKDQVEMAYSGDRSLEFTDAGVTKGAALADLAGRLSIPIEQTIAIGDNRNDISMLKAAGLGVAVANAAPQAKESADIVLDETNDENAVAVMLEKYVLH